LSNDPSKGWVMIEDIAEPAYPPFVVDNLVHEAITVMYGRPESGKSYLALALAVSLTTGEPFLGHRVRERRKVAFLALDPNQVSETMRRRQSLGASGILLSSRKPGQTAVGWQSDAMDLQRLGVDFLIIDNLTRLMPPGESVREDGPVGPVLDNISIMVEHGIGVLLLHHSGKTGEDGNPKTTPLGATCIEAWARHFVRVDATTSKATSKIDSRTALSYGNELAAAPVKIPFEIMPGGSIAAATPSRDRELTEARLQSLIDGGPWANQAAMGKALDLSQTQVSRLLDKAGYHRDRRSGLIVPRDDLELAA
jgi:hypothetical protein